MVNGGKALSRKGHSRLEVMILNGVFNNKIQAVYKAYL